MNKEFFLTTKFPVDDHKIVAQDYVHSYNFDSNINYLKPKKETTVASQFKELLFIKSCSLVFETSLLHALLDLCCHITKKEKRENCVNRGYLVVLKGRKIE